MEFCIRKYPMNTLWFPYTPKLHSMDKQTFLIALVAIIAGFIGGFAVNANQASPAGYHTMSNGMMMEDSGMAMGHAMDEMMLGLRGKTGDAFDRAFLEGMIVHHQGAVDMAGDTLRNAKHPELKDFAQKIITAQSAEIQQMKDWQKAWYNQ